MKSNYVKTAVKDTVFRDIFSNKEYLLELYKTLHPEDDDVTEDELHIVTLKTILANDLYNDLGFQVRDKLLILVEAQTTWTENILVRSLLYLASTYKEYFDANQINLYGSTKVKMPKPELYVIYTGERGDKKKVLSLKNDFFAGESCLDLKIKVLFLGRSNNIINQYIRFCRIITEQVKLYGRTLTAIKNTIRLCRNKNYLRKYLNEREKEVLTMLNILFDQELIFNNCMHEQMQAGMQAGMQVGRLDTYRDMLASGMLTLEQIKKSGKLTAEEIESLQQ